MALKPLVVQTAAANVEVLGSDDDFRFLKMLTVSPVSANVQIKLLEPTDSGDYFPMDVRSRISRPIQAVPIAKLYVKSDTANTTITFLKSLVDNFMEDAPNGGPAGTGGSGITAVSTAEVLGLNADAQFNGTITAGTNGNFGGWDTTRARAVWFTVDPAAASGLWMQSSTPTSKLGIYLAPGIPTRVQATVPAGGNQGKMQFYNPSASNIPAYAFVEYNT